eukprot:716323_1
MLSSSGNVGLAYAVSAGAGLATSIGAAIPLFRNIKPSDRRWLTASLAMSAGVMIFVSFTEILQSKAIGSALAALGCLDSDSVCHKEKRGQAAAIAYGCFFLGIFVCKLLDVFCRMLTTDTACPGAMEDMFKQTSRRSVAMECMPTVKVDIPGVGTMDQADTQQPASDPQQPTSDPQQPTSDPQQPTSEGKPPTKHPSLMKLSMMTGMALVVHNFPEGMATFSETLRDEGAGIALAVAIGIHNIPEGLAVSMPIFYATGNRWKAFWWGTLSGIAEPVGAVIAHAFLTRWTSPLAYAILFGLVAGMMVYIVVAELLPNAFNGDPEGKLVIPSFCIGLGVMALSLVLFGL